MESGISLDVLRTLNQLAVSVLLSLEQYVCYIDFLKYYEHIKHINFICPYHIKYLLMLESTYMNMCPK